MALKYLRYKGKTWHYQTDLGGYAVGQTEPGGWRPQPARNSKQIENNCEDTRPVLWVVVVGEKYAPTKATLFDVNMALARRDAGASAKEK